MGYFMTRKHTKMIDLDKSFRSCVSELKLSKYCGSSRHPTMVVLTQKCMGLGPLLAIGVEPICPDMGLSTYRMPQIHLLFVCPCVSE